MIFSSRIRYIGVVVIGCGYVTAPAQSSPPSVGVPSSFVASTPAPQVLPDTPSSLMPSANAAGSQTAQPGDLKVAPRYAAIIEPEYQAQQLGAGVKVTFAANEIVSLHYVAGTVLAAGYSQGVNSDPKYGTNSEAFAKRVGAAGARGASQIIFSEALLSPVLHEDPRYYVLGSKHHVLTRALYAASRVLIGRKDSGTETINLSQLIGYGGSAALSQLYYPVGSRSHMTILSGYGESLGGLAIQNEVNEFIRSLVRHQPR